MKNLVRVLFLALLILLSQKTFAATYYVTNNDGIADGLGWGVGSNSNAGTKLAPWLTIGYGCNTMQAGDTLVIANGVYTSTANMVNNHTLTAPPEGSVGAYTVVMAENTGQVFINGEGSYRPLTLEGNDTVGSHTGASVSRDYIEFRGIVFSNSAYGCVYIAYVNHVKMINCGAFDAANGYQVFDIDYCTYMLFEGCYGYGNGRYTFKLYDVRQSIVRNCVMRLDRMNEVNPMGVFSLYGSWDIEVQNCVVVDSDQSAYHLNYYQDQGCFGNPGTSSRDDSGVSTFTNCIAVNNHLRFGTSDWGQYRSSAVYKNCVGWGHVLPQCSKSIPIIEAVEFFGSTGDSYFENCTFGAVTTYNNGVLEGGAAHHYGVHSPVNINETHSTIFYNFSGGDLFQAWEESDNNLVYGIGEYVVDRVGSATSTNLKTYDPTLNGLTSYILRIETGSQLATDGIGATILYQHGATGTLWGDTGYNLLQDGTNGQATVKLWPFPNEDIIKANMAAYSYDSGNLSGARGFCAAGKQLNGVDDITLTSYIWEYLGNEIPEDIYAVPPVHDAPIVTILTESQSTTSGTITIIGTLTTDSELTGTGVDVNGIAATADDGTWDEAVEAWTALGVTLSLGANTITATGTDSEAETDTDTVIITRTAPGTSSGVTIQGVQWNQ